MQATLHNICPGSFGELLFGRVHGVPLHVTMPINRFASAKVSFSHQNIKLLDLESQLVHQAISLLSSVLALPLANIAIESNIPKNLGMAGLQAILVAATDAYLNSLNVKVNYNRELICFLLKRILGCHGLGYNGIVSFAHQSSRLIESFGTPRIDILGVVLTEPTHTWKTQDFYQTSPYSTSELKQLATAYDLAKLGTKARNIKAIGKASTLSALVNQEHRPKPKFKDLIELAKTHAAEGVIVSQYGDALGVILPEKLSKAQTHDLSVGLKELFGVLPQHYSSWNRKGQQNFQQIAKGLC